MNEPWILYSLHVSPWSERARWALDHHGLAFREVEHVPMLGEARLRRLVRRAAPDLRSTAPSNGRRKATVPLLVAGDTVVIDSWNIAHYADRARAAMPLVPPERAAEIAEWNQVSESMLISLRALAMRTIINRSEALDEALPGFVPRPLRPLFRPVGRAGAKYLARKHGLGPADDEARHEAALVPLLDRLRAAVSALAADRLYLLGDFSYADVLMASALQGIQPVADRFWSLGPITREVWTRRSLAARYPDLIAWRDRLYERHREPPRGRA